MSENRHLKSKVTVLSKNTSQSLWPGLEPGPLDLVASELLNEESNKPA